MARQQRKSNGAATAAPSGAESRCWRLGSLLARAVYSVKRRLDERAWLRLSRELDRDPPDRRASSLRWWRRRRGSSGSR